MSGLDQLMRLQRWTLDEKRRQASDLELLIERLATSPISTAK
jgi:flagellar protein FliJ